MEERRLEGARLLKAGRLSQAAIARQLVGRQWRNGRSNWPSWDCEVSRLAGRLASCRPINVSAWLACLNKERVGLPLTAGRSGGFNRWLPASLASPTIPNMSGDWWRRWTGVCKRRARERDEELIRAWFSRDWPRIKKARRLGADIMFEDEFGFSFTWAPRGQTKGVGKYRREVSTISGKIYKRHFGRAVRADDLIVGLSPSPATSLHPGLGSVAGPSGETSARLPGNSVIVEWLPPYAPDLNPEEYCQNSV